MKWWRHTALYSGVFAALLAVSFFAWYTIFSAETDESGVPDDSLSLFADVRKEISIGESTFQVTVADDRKEREKGLSGTEQLLPEEGKLFIFDYEYTHGFWMKDMSYAIDIVWFNKEYELVHVAENVQPESYPEVFSPTTDALYVVELLAGTVEKHNLQEGMLLQGVD